MVQLGQRIVLLDALFSSSLLGSNKPERLTNHHLSTEDGSILYPCPEDLGFTGSPLIATATVLIRAHDNTVADAYKIRQKAPSFSPTQTISRRDDVLDDSRPKGMTSPKC